VVLGVEILVRGRDIEPLDPIRSGNDGLDVLRSVNGGASLEVDIPGAVGVEVNEGRILITFEAENITRPTLVNCKYVDEVNLPVTPYLRMRE
jgi:hypothetical protein